ncbi:MAG TPA: hypothetical protein VJT67_17665 [Longimicrobiaceae bacterium]|nr:hypothetical protein [Longimicrobiaceae bacterium]
MRSSALRRLMLPLGLLLCAACPSPPSSAPSTNGVSPQEMRALERLVAQRSVRARAAWQSRNPRLLVTGADSAVMGRRPDGTPVTNAEIRADLARRMAVVVRLDTLSEVITAVRASGDSVEVTTRQRFVRLVRTDTGDRVRVSGVTHRQWFRRERGAFVAVTPLQESEQEAYWADERPRG